MLYLPPKADYYMIVSEAKGRNMENDPRYIKLRFGLNQLSNIELKRILDYKGDMVYDDYNYDQRTGRY
jgi:hypothetical protein